MLALVADEEPVICVGEGTGCVFDVSLDAGLGADAGAKVVGDPTSHLHALVTTAGSNGQALGSMYPSKPALCSAWQVRIGWPGNSRTRCRKVTVIPSPQMLQDGNPGKGGLVTGLTVGKSKDRTVVQPRRNRKLRIRDIVVYVCRLQVRFLV